MLVCGNRWHLGLTACWGLCLVAWRSYAPWNVLQLRAATMQAVTNDVRACLTYDAVLMTCHHCFAPLCLPAALCPS